MSLQRADGAAVALLRSSAAWRRGAASATATSWRILSRGLSSSSSNNNSSSKRKKAGKLPEDAKIAVLGGGLTGLTTAYYLAKWLPSTTKITLLEAGDRLGGWIRTDKVPVKVGGVEGVVNFERGPRSFSSLNKSTWRFDDLVLWDLVRLVCYLPLSTSLQLRQRSRGTRLIHVDEGKLTKSAVCRCPR